MLIEHMRSTALPSGQSTCMTVVYNKDNFSIRHVITGKIIVSLSHVDPGDLSHCGDLGGYLCMGTRKYSHETFCLAPDFNG